MRRSAGMQLVGGRAWARARVYVIPVLVLLAITLPHLGQGDFRTDTGWYSAIGLSSVRHWFEASGLGDALTLQAEPGKPFFNKPPLALWIHGVFLQVFGVSLIAARLPTILAACGCVALTVGIVRTRGTRTQAMLAGLALALTLEFFRRTKEVSLDMWQILFMLGAVRAVVARGGAASGAVSGACIGLALLCKPLVALLGSVVLIAWLVRERRASVRWVAVHVAVALAIALPWYLVMVAEHGGAFLRKHFVGEIAVRAAGAMAPTGGGGEPVWFYLEDIGGTYWPWLIPAVLAIVAYARGELTARAGRLVVLGVVWFAAWLVLLSVFPDRRPRYALVLWPAGAWLAGIWLGSASARWARPAVRAFTAWGAVAAVVGGVVFALAPVKVQSPPDRQWGALFEWLEEEGRPEVWQGGFRGPSQSRVYLRFGAWPRQTLARDGTIVTPPPVGAVLLYHRRDGLIPGEGEEVIFHEGDLTATRLTAPVWAPVATPDPGEDE